MKGSLIVVSVLIIGLLISLQSMLLANATKKEVTGVVDFSEPAFRFIAPGEEWVDNGGNTHIKGLVYEGAVSLTIVGEQTIKGRDRIVINGVHDDEGNGTYQITKKTYFIGEYGDDPTDDNIFFEGRGQLMIKEYQTTSGHFQLTGHGEFAGTKLIITTFVAIGMTNIHELEGILVDLGKDE
jgi:hypothetical protein